MTTTTPLKPVQHYRGFELRTNGHKVLIIDEHGIFGETPTMGAALRLIDGELGPEGPEAA